jgi:phage protein D
MTDALLITSQPIFSIGGQAATTLTDDVLQLEVHENTEGLKTLVVRFIAQGRHPGDPDESLLYLDGALFDFGKSLQLTLGPDSNAQQVFDGAISAIEASFRSQREPQVVVRAEDRLMDLRMTRRVKTYENVSDADIAQAIGAEHGLTVEADADGPTYDRVQQWNQSDLAFLRERARLLDAELWVAGGTLHFKARENRSAPALTLVQGNQLLEVDLVADLAHQRTRIQVSGFDASQRAQIDEAAGADAIAAETSGGRTGVQVLSDAFGDRVSLRVREVPLVAAEATAWARAEMLRRARGFVQVHGVTDGSPEMAVGSRLRLEGVGPPFEGDGYCVTDLRHRWDRIEGFRTRFVAERATVNAP